MDVADGCGVDAPREVEEEVTALEEFSDEECMRRRLERREAPLQEP